MPVCVIGNSSNCCPRWFLDEDDIKTLIDFEYGVNKRISSDLSKSYRIAIHS